MGFFQAFLACVSSVAKPGPPKITPALPLQPHPPRHPGTPHPMGIAVSPLFLAPSSPSTSFVLCSNPGSCLFLLFILAGSSLFCKDPPPLHPVLRCTALKASLPFTRAAIATAGDATARPSWLGPSAREQYLLQAFSAPSR